VKEGTLKVQLCEQRCVPTSCKAVLVAGGISIAFATLQPVLLLFKGSYRDNGFKLFSSVRQIVSGGTDHGWGHGRLDSL